MGPSVDIYLGDMVAGNWGEYLTFEINPFDRGHNVEYINILIVTLS